MPAASPEPPPLAKLRQFCAVAEAGGVRHAAELLGVSPSALSKTVAELEQDLGRPLFARAGRGLALTDDGRRLHGLATKLLADHARLWSELRGETKSGEALVRIGSFEVFTTHFLGEAARRFFAGVPILLLELGPGRIEDAIVQGEIDVGLTYAPVPHPEVAFLPVAAFRMGTFVRKGAFEDTPDPELPFAVPVTPIGGSVAAFRSLDGWPEGRVARRVAYRCELLESSLELARQGLAAIHAPRFVVELANRGLEASRRLVPREFGRRMRPVEMTAHVVKRKDALESPAMKKLARAVRTILREADSAGAGG
jgi:DNA-binding transcriptional LysR family regulator